MSWDGVGRRPVRDKQNENRQLRALMLSLLKSHDDVFQRIVSLNLSASLLEAYLEARRLDGNFKARRRIERHIVNLVRLTDEEDLSKLESLVSEPERFQEAYLHAIDDCANRLMSDGAALAAFVEDRPGVDVQQLRSLIRNAKKARDSPKTAPMTKLKAFLSEWID